MYLYLDLIWLLNFFIDYLLLWMTGLFRKLEVKKWRVGLASAVGSCYVLFLFFPPLLPLYTFGVKVILSILLILIAFGFGNIQKIVLNFLTFYFVSFVTGGGLLAMHFYFQSNHEIFQGMVSTQSTGYGDKISWLFVGLGFPIMYWFSKSRWRQIEATKIKSHSLSRVQFYFNQISIECVGLVDTGNQLYEPITKAPVMMVDARCFQNKLPHSLLEHIQTTADILNIDGLELTAEWMQRIRIVPYRGVRQGMEMMLALKPDHVVIVHDEMKYQSHKVLIGLNPQPLSTEGLFQAIVHPALIQNQQKEEAI